MSFMILDPLYGPLRHGPEDALAVALYETRAMARLRDISQSSVPSRMQPTGEASSRFEHSVGVMHLARTVARRREFRPYRPELIAAALLHDAASPPFSHVSETFQYAATGRTHEQSVLEIVDGRTEVGRLLRKFDVDPEAVMALIEGRHPTLGGIIAGAPDLDNADHQARLLASLGGLGVKRHLPYQPERLVGAFRLIEGGRRVELHSSALQDLLGWAEARRRLYNDVLYSEINMAAAAMLYRSLEFMFFEDQLGEEFYRLGESTALDRLLTSGVVPARRLAEDAIRWRFHRRVYDLHPAGKHDAITTLGSNLVERKRFMDAIATTLGLREYQVSIYAGRQKIKKAVHYNFVGPYAGACRELFKNRLSRQRLSVFIDRDVVLPKRRIEAAVNGALSEVPKTEEGYIFY